MVYIDRPSAPGTTTFITFCDSTYRLVFRFGTSYMENMIALDLGVISWLTKKKKGRMEWNNLKRIFLSLIIVEFVLIVITVIVLIYVEDLNTTDSFYLTVSTLTTTGFGNVSPESDTAKVFISLMTFLLTTIFFILISVITVMLSFKI